MGFIQKRTSNVSLHALVTTVNEGMFFASVGLYVCLLATLLSTLLTYFDILVMFRTALQ